MPSSGAHTLLPELSKAASILLPLVPRRFLQVILIVPAFQDEKATNRCLASISNTICCCVASGRCGIG